MWKIAVDLSQLLAIPFVIWYTIALVGLMLITCALVVVISVSWLMVALTSVSKLWRWSNAKFPFGALLLGMALTGLSLVAFCYGH